MRGGARKGTGGAMPGAGRRPDSESKTPWAIRLSDKQRATLKSEGGAPWFQGVLNLLGADKPESFVLLQLDALEKKHGREWLRGLAGKINERANREQ